MNISNFFQSIKYLGINVPATKNVIVHAWILGFKPVGNRYLWMGSKTSIVQCDGTQVLHYVVNVWGGTISLDA